MPPLATSRSFASASHPRDNSALRTSALSSELGSQSRLNARQILLNGRADDRKIDMGLSVSYPVAGCPYVRPLLAEYAVSNFLAHA